MPIYELKCRVKYTEHKNFAALFNAEMREFTEVSSVCDILRSCTHGLVRCSYVSTYLQICKFAHVCKFVKQAEIIEALKSTARYLDDLLNIDNPYFEGMVNRIYPPELQLNKANTSDTEAPFLDLHLSISNGFVSSKTYDKRDDFDFDVVNFLFWMVTFPVLSLTGFTFLNLFGLLKSNHVADFNVRNKSLTAKLLQQGYRYHKLRKTFSEFYRRHYELVSKFNVGLKTLLHQSLSEPESYGDLVYKFKKHCR